MDQSRISDKQARDDRLDEENSEDERTEHEEGEANQPGLSDVREAVANYAQRHTPGRGVIRDDGIAGLNSALSSIPDGMASGLLAGVNPIYGLYACIVGPIMGAILSSTQLMLIVTTSASALGAGQALSGIASEDRENALFVLVIVIGVVQIIFGLLRLGRLTRFVSFSVMTGFIAGIAVLTILTQLPTTTGYEPSGSNRVSQTIDIVAHAGGLHLLTVIVTVSALALAIVLPRTRAGNLGNLAAIAIPSVLLVLFGAGSVEIVKDVGEIPSGIPTPSVPSFSAASFDLITGAMAVAVVILVQGVGVSQSVPNPDGSRRRASRDFIAQGGANVASGFFRGMPVGGSLSTTALTVASGSRSRWAAVFAGLWVLAGVLIFSNIVSYIAMPTLAAVLIVASARTIKPEEVSTIWEAGWPARVASATTFLSTLFLPIQAAVGIGVALSALLSVFAASADISVVELVKRSDGRIEERKPAKELSSNTATVLDVYGSLFFAGARTLERKLPTPQGAEHAVVVLRLRGRSTFGATLVDVLANYASKLEEGHGRLYLSGISEGAFDQVIATGKLQLSGPVRIHEVTPIRMQSTSEAYADAQAWLANLNSSRSKDEDASNGASAHAREAHDDDQH
jgi:sulfate permease, SulP family